jgi:hypothetical protein
MNCNLIGSISGKECLSSIARGKERTLSGTLSVGTAARMRNNYNLSNSGLKT